MKYPHYIDIGPPQNFGNEQAIDDWCCDQFGRYDQLWTTSFLPEPNRVRFYFTQSKHAVLFALRWS